MVVGKGWGEGGLAVMEGNQVSPLLVGVFPVVAGSLSLPYIPLLLVGSVRFSSCLVPTKLPEGTGLAVLRQVSSLEHIQVERVAKASV